MPTSLPIREETPPPPPLPVPSLGAAPPGPLRGLRPRPPGAFEGPVGGRSGDAQIRITIASPQPTRMPPPEFFVRFSR
ncbi:hypothetical protein GT031_35535 [Streptomyces sp. SID2888]|nr:hypothetical protein [Streptomyces sp. SID2888]